MPVHYSTDDGTDSEAFRLLERIAEKAVEPLSDDADPNKTLGECRQEMVALLMEAVDFVRARRSARSAAEKP